jgi:valyl-tRNA synthetase
METGYDILFFWVARMIMLGLYNMAGVPPFRWVYLHGLVRDAHGIKMSKTKGNVVDPLELVDRYGADALRFTLVTGSSPGNDMKLQDSDLENARNFANKLWNTARFVLRYLDDPALTPGPSPAGAGEGSLTQPRLNEAPPLPSRRERGLGGEGRLLEDRWITARLAALTEEVNRLAGDFQLGQAAQRLYDFVWHEYADWYIEMAKVRVNRGDRSPVPVLLDVLATSLRLLHPYMPYVTEEIWQNLRPHLGADAPAALIVAPYPLAQDTVDIAAVRLAETLIEVVRAARNARSERRIPPAQYAESFLAVPDATVRAALEDRKELIEALARLRPLHIVAGMESVPRENVATAVLADATAAILLEGVDVAAERTRLQREIDEVQAYIAKLEAQLGNESFRTKAPERVVRDMEEKLAGARTRLDGLRRSLSELPS